jgi:hypothetical protein
MPNTLDQTTVMHRVFEAAQADLANDEEIESVDSGFAGDETLTFSVTTCEGKTFHFCLQAGD